MGYGRPQRFLTDNGRELANSEFVELALQFDITVKTTPSEPALPNRVAEQHKIILGEMLEKSYGETTYQY